MMNFSELHRLPSSEFERTFSIIPKLESTVKIVAQAYISDANFEFRIYIFKNEKDELTLLFNSVFVHGEDEGYKTIGLNELLNISKKIFGHYHFSQMLIPIAEVGGYPFSSQRSRHFILLCINDNQAVVYDSNPSYHIRKTRDKDIQPILHQNGYSYDKSSYYFFTVPNREHIGIQPLGDNQSCGYQVINFIRSRIVEPSKKLDLEDLQKSIKDTMYSMTGFFQMKLECNNPYYLPFNITDRLEMKQKREHGAYFYCEQTGGGFSLIEMLEQWMEKRNAVIKMIEPKGEALPEASKAVLYHFEMIDKKDEKAEEDAQASTLDSFVVFEEYERPNPP